MMFLAAVAVQAQISIGGNVYGGGNAGDLGGSTTVTVHAGDISAVYGGARMANVGGYTYVNIDGAHASEDILITTVYGGNDISGTIGQSNVTTTIPTELANFEKSAGVNAIDNTWKTFIRTSPCVKYTPTTPIEGVTGDVEKYAMVIGTLYGAGNGDYVYKDAQGNDLTDGNGNYIVRDANGNTVATSTSPFNKPELAKTYLELKGGCIAHAYGGGNAATVTSNTTINIDNSSDDLQKAVTVWRAVKHPEESMADVFAYLQSKLNISTTQSDLSSYAFNFARVFGGNNKADMAIRPKWHLQRGIIRDLYGGGNEGRMTSHEGLLLQVDGEGMTVQNVYGGCRKADVQALDSNGTPIPYADIQLDPSDNPNNIPGGYAARVRVLAGHVTNVYGGNDISGNVYGGSTVGILTRIYGNVYGGGNGSYAYTDNVKLKDDPDWRDFYYDPDKILQEAGITGVAGKLKSAEALNIFRPNAERVSILVRGTQANPTVVDGALYVGGNSASLRSQTSGGSSGSNMTHVKIGSYVTIDNVFLGNNGENMVKYDAPNALGQGEGVLHLLARTDIASDGTKFNSMVLTDGDVFAKYMEGCAMKVNPTIVFESTQNGDAQNYVPYSTKFGSLFCGGNVGSIIIPGKITVDFNDKIIIYDKVVGGCNNANVYQTDYNAEYLGGMLGAAAPVPDGSPANAIGDKLELNFGGLKIQPMRWNAEHTALIWNTISASTGLEVNPTDLTPGTSTTDDLDRRLKGGNIYGGCYNTGHVNGNVIINLNASTVDRKGEFAIFDQIEQNEGEAILYGNDSYNITERRSGVILDRQGMDVLGKALNVFGGGYGGDSEIWGSTTINLNAGYTFQIFGGGEQGPIGKAVSHEPNPLDPSIHDLTYENDDRYSCYVNVRGSQPGVYRGHTDDSDDMAEAEFIYGGGFLGTIAGNTMINLGNGRVFNTFAGSCNADILGHTETYIGRQANSDGTYTDGGGFPWIRDHVYGGNDLGGQILGSKNFIDRVDSDVQAKIHNPKALAQPEVTNASAYMEYQQGRVDYIFGGCYGDYDYTSDYFSAYTNADGSDKDGFIKPRLNNAFVNFKANTHARNAVNRIYGAGQGAKKGIEVDKMQNRSYVLVETPQNITKFQNVKVFGAGANCGLGMNVDPTSLVNHVDANDQPVAGQPDNATAIIDLVKGQIHSAYGGSYEEGITRRTMINVPNGSTIKLDNIFGGAYGADPLYPCDVYEAKVNYSSEDARVSKIYGGNNNADRTLYGQVNINSVVWQNKESGYLGTVFGAGCGEGTWSQYTEVNLNDGAKVYEVYGGGQAGKVLNTESLLKWRHDEGAALDLSLPGYEDTSVTYKDKDNADFHLDAGLNSPLVRPASLDGVSKYNTNVHINKGATVVNYAYGGGLGTDAVVSGTTYIDLLGGTVTKDLYAAGTSGAVLDYYKVGAKSDLNPNGFTASATAYIEGGSARNVYGGGWEGDVGYHDKTTTATTDDIPGETHVVIGIRQDQASLPEGYGFYKGVPAIQRNAYSGGEGGSVFGTANLTLNNGYIGYTYDTSTNKYEEKIHDETWTDHVGLDRLSDCGNLFGGGYDDNSSVDFTNVTVWGGVVRNSVFGGGEIATIGRGKVKESDTDNKVRELDAVYKFGSTNIEIFNGHIKRNVFGGGKGYNILGYGGIHGFYTDGYVFGSTEVHVHGGEVGTEAGIAEGYGNVFGGGDVGFVYGKGFFSDGTAAKENTGSPNHIYYKDGDGNLTEDCKVVVAPMLQIRKGGSSVTYDGKTYGPYDYVPTDYLNKLEGKSDNAWTNFYTGDKDADGNVIAEDPVDRGIHIHNAVFAGGNVSSNSESYANATTVFGNTTATLYDVFHRDFITVGTEHTGGLYGGGNLSVVGGYRELNITNYGTDYYGLNSQISLEEYRKLSNRERAYFQLEYLCINSYGEYIKDQSRLTEEQYNKLTDAEKANWEQYGFCSIYAGRLLNTIQRADFCGVYGSRLVLQGAKDRVADVADATEYTINRVGEVSLNQQRFTPGSDAEIHGNYFGIYSVVNYMGNLTSDVHFTDDRRYVEGLETKVDTQHSYYDWKTGRLDKRDRNNGTAYNQVALASGVFLELTTENSTTSNKIYGDITGIIELDLINVKKDIEGGGYVYARNEHRIPKYFPQKKNVLLSEYNQPKTVDNVEIRDEACTHKRYIYSAEDETLYGEGTPQQLGTNEPYTVKSYQTSGNFIHKSKRIVDDCYPNNGVYQDEKGLYVTSPAHYWYIKGEVYIYDQVVSAYAGSASAYSKEVKIPLTITAGANGKLKLLNIQPSLYAYYGDEAQTTRMGSEGVKVDNESMTYHLNDVITWWDWHQLAQNEQKYFVKNTYVNVDPCTINGTPYEAEAYVVDDMSKLNGLTIKNSKNETVTGDALNTLFRSSNNISHETGYVLTLDMNSPKDWDDWYSPIDANSDLPKIRKDAYEALSASEKLQYREGPTFQLTGSSGLYGQRQYAVGEIISKEVYDDYTNTVAQMSPQPEGQATVDPAYVALVDIGNMQAGNAISETEWNARTDKSNFAPAMVCINSIQIGDEEYILMGELVSGKAEDLTALAQKYKTYNNNKINADQLTDEQALEYVQSRLSNAYYIKSDGLYGGQYFQAGQNYGAIKSWCSLTDARTNFNYNYDALDVLVDSQYHGEGYTETYYKSPYSDIKPVEYKAFNTGATALTYYDNNGTQHTLAAGGSIDRVDYENVRNDQLHYTRLAVEAGSDSQTFYIVKETMINKGTPYAQGQDISEKDFNSLTDANKEKVAQVTIQKSGTAAVHYYCYETYTPQNTSFSVESGTAGQAGSIISATVFNENIPNYQKAFSIQGAEPTETTTLYVSRESNAKDVTAEKVISVVYQYTYYEADDEGEGVSLVNELHVLNIHLQMESGAPEIGPLTAPPAVLPGNTVGLKAPSVNPGLYEILTSGWELFNDEQDAQMHRNGTPFTNNGTPLYWYQDQKVWLAFYSKTYLGKTYSNYVPLTVANYHDLDAIMKDKEHHLYVDHPGVARNSKIYIDNRDCESDATKSELDLLKDFFDLSVNSGSPAVAGHAPLDEHVKAGQNLEFILNSDVSPKAYTNWTPIGDDSQCFEGTFHGDGYTISELNNSLFGKLCGSVYNLGVTGSFTSAGVVDTGDGYVENCWINTSGTPDGSVKAVFGNPTRNDGTQIVNCYYPDTNPDTKTYNTTDNGRGLATPMTETEFYNGTVAYNLNGFYLNKRYYDHNVPSGSPTAYKYLKQEADGNLSETPLTGYYPTAPDAQYGDVGYVEHRYADGDFVYAGGTVPEAYDDRMRVVVDGTTSTVTYSPIWPDDYIYFGQKLTYGHSAAQAHQELPAHINKSSNRLPMTESSNRVYRAPAYYQSKTMDKVHYNLNAYLAAKSAPKTITDTDLKDAYPNMTAVDFAGHNDNTWSLGSVSDGFAVGSPAFYPPLLDNVDGLLSISNEGETPNLLVYAPSAEENEKTHQVLTGYFVDPDYTSYYIDDAYRCVQSAPVSTVHGHVVQSNLKATNDHLLVDKKDFNCPISYQFADGYRMWYQRTPDLFVNLTKGWETVSLPFTAELVTTQQKGEITHFYSGSRSIEDGVKIGHEYWLREYKGVTVPSGSPAGVVTATCSYPTASGSDKTVGNTFLWDYYYSKNTQQDANADTYQTYYETSRDYAAYPLLATATPYIVGFPGKTYYEFDLSGEWTAQNTATTPDGVPAQLDKQTISFVSEAEITVGVSDDELTATTADNYGFMPNYMSKVVEGYLMNADGNSFEATPDGGSAATPFRPYFVAVPASPAPARTILFDNDDSSFAFGENDPAEGNFGEGTLLFNVHSHMITVTSSLHRSADVRIVNTGGLTIANFTIQPGESIDTNIGVAGVYMVRADGGRYQKKLAIK